MVTPTRTLNLITRQIEIQAVDSKPTLRTLLVYQNKNMGILMGHNA